MPVADIKWMVDQPERILSANKLQKEILQSDRTLLDASLQENPVHISIIRRDLTRGLGALIPDIEDELTISIEECSGTNSEKWTNISVFPSMMKVISRATSRVFVGLPLCQHAVLFPNLSNTSQVAMTNTSPTPLNWPKTSPYPPLLSASSRPS